MNMTFEDGTALWVGILSIVSGSIGLACWRKVHNRCLLVSYFILCILVAVASGILALVSLGHTFHVFGYKYGTRMVLFFTNATLTLSALAHGICCIISSSILCYSWGCNCCGDGNGYQQPSSMVPGGQNTVIYMPNTGVTQQFHPNQKYILVPMSSAQTFGPDHAAMVQGQIPTTAERLGGTTELMLPQNQIP